MIKKLIILIILTLISRPTFAVQENVIIGSKSAPVEIKVYYSATCAACGTIHNEVLSKIQNEYVNNDQANIKYMPYPLDTPSILTETYLACIPSADKHKQALNDILSNQSKWMFEGDIIEAIKNIMLKYTSEDILTKCETDEDSYKQLSNKIISYKQKKIVKRTPTIFINGSPVKIPSYVHIKNKIDRELNK